MEVSVSSFIRSLILHLYCTFCTCTCISIACILAASTHLLHHTVALDNRSKVKYVYCQGQDVTELKCDKENFHCLKQSTGSVA